MNKLIIGMIALAAFLGCTKRSTSSNALQNEKAQEESLLTKIGIELISISNEESQEVVSVASVKKRSISEAAGFEKDDIIIEVLHPVIYHAHKTDYNPLLRYMSQPIKRVQDFSAAYRVAKEDQSRVGDFILLKVMRRNQKISIKLEFLNP